MSPLRWTCKSVRRLAAELRAMGHAIGHMTVRDLLQGLNFSLQAKRKTRGGDQHPDRDAQFAYLNTAVSAALAVCVTLSPPFNLITWLKECSCAD
jgi:hypothetical protein